MVPTPSPGVYKLSPLPPSPFCLHVIKKSEAARQAKSKKGFVSPGGIICCIICNTFKMENVETVLTDTSASTWMFLASLP